MDGKIIASLDSHGISMKCNMTTAALRTRLVEMLAKRLNKSSRYYEQDYNGIVKAANRKSRKELIEALHRWNAITNITDDEIEQHCQLKGLC